MLRGLGVVDVSHGRRTRVRKIDTKILDQLLPVMLALDGQRTFQQVFDVRIAIESRSAFLAAKFRTEAQLLKIYALAKKFQRLVRTASTSALKTDFEFHLKVAEATDNPLFPILLGAITRLVVFGQTESCKDDPERRRRAVRAHNAIAEAIADRDSERAQAEMEAHLRYSASRMISALEMP